MTVFSWALLNPTRFSTLKIFSPPFESGLGDYGHFSFPSNPSSLRPVWNTKTHTASSLCGQMRSTLSQDSLSSFFLRPENEKTYSRGKIRHVACSAERRQVVLFHNGRWSRKRGLVWVSFPLTFRFPPLSLYDTVMKTKS